MKSLLKAIFVNTVSLTLIGIGAVALFILSIIALVVMSSSRTPSIAKGSVLVFDLGVNLTEAAPVTTPNDALAAAFSGGENPRVSLHSAIDALRRAKDDANICALYLQGSLLSDGYSSGFAALKELREAIAGFQASGKPVRAYLVSPSQRDYYLTSAAGAIYLNPYGELQLTGLHSESPFFASALQKYGIGIQVTRVGKFKSAVEPFLLDRMSDESREQTRTLMEDLWTHYKSAVETSRHLEFGTLQRLADTEGVIQPEAAVTAKLVDKTAYLSDVISDLAALSKSKGGTSPKGSFTQIELRDYIERSQPADELEALSQSQIALVCAEGDIMDGESHESGIIGGDSLARQLREIRQDDKVKAIVLRVNSPGGSVVASEVIAHELAQFRAKKIPFVVSMGTVAASGGYWISTFSDRIFAEPNTITGSIGVFGLMPNIQKIANDHGVTFDGVGTAKFSGVNTISRPKTDEELALIQKVVDDIYQKFLLKVAESRKLSLTQVGEIAQGRVWSGEDAQKLGLVDELGGLQSAVTYAATAAKLGKRYAVVQYPRAKKLPEAIREMLEKTGERPVAKSDPVTRLMNGARSELQTLSTLNDPRHIYARLPVTLRVD